MLRGREEHFWARYFQSRGKAAAKADHTRPQEAWLRNPDCTPSKYAGNDSEAPTAVASLIFSRTALYLR